MRKYKKIISENGIDKDDPNLVLIKEMLINHNGYMDKFIEWYFTKSVTIEKLREVLDMLLSTKLDKDINSFSNVDDLVDYIEHINIKTSINQLKKSLPSNSRKLWNEDLSELVKKNLNLSKYIKDFYSKKGGRYKTIESLYKSTKDLIDNLSEDEYTIESIKHFCDDQVVYKDMTTLILSIESYLESKLLGSKFWCISESETHWNLYSSNFKKTYFIYDFSKKRYDKESLIGVTVKYDGSIYVSFYSNDEYIDPYSPIIEQYREYLKPYSQSYINKRVNVNDIVTLSSLGWLEVIKSLVNTSSIWQNNIYKAFESACDNSQFEVIKYFIEDVSVRKYLDLDIESLNSIIRSNNIEIFKYVFNNMVNNNITIDVDDLCEYASIYGSKKIYDFLSKKGVSNYSKSKCLMNSAYSGHSDIYKELFRDKNIEMSFPDTYVKSFRQVAGTRKTDLVKFILDNYDFSEKSKELYDMFYISLAYGDINSVKYYFDNTTFIRNIDKSSIIYVLYYTMVGGIDILKHMINEYKLEIDKVSYKSFYDLWNTDTSNTEREITQDTFIYLLNNYGDRISMTPLLFRIFSFENILNNTSILDGIMNCWNFTEYENEFYNSLIGYGRLSEEMLEYIYESDKSRSFLLFSVLSELMIERNYNDLFIRISNDLLNEFSLNADLVNYSIKHDNKVISEYLMKFDHFYVSNRDFYEILFKYKSDFKYKIFKNYIGTLYFTFKNKVKSVFKK